MSNEDDPMDVDFHHWRALTDLYLEELEALRQHKAGASTKLTAIANDLRRYCADFQRSHPNRTDP